MTSFGLTCPTPAILGRPTIPKNSDHVFVPLSVRSSETNKDFVSRNFAYYDCGRHATCENCVKSQWGCIWCTYENKCTDNSTACQKTGFILSGKNVSIVLYMSRLVFQEYLLKFLGIGYFKYRKL